jgi:hypothetical protein
MACALAFALDSAGKSMAARMAMMAITTKSSINVNPRNVDLENDFVFKVVMGDIFCWFDLSDPFDRSYVSVIFNSTLARGVGLLQADKKRFCNNSSAIFCGVFPV